MDHGDVEVTEHPQKLSVPRDSAKEWEDEEGKQLIELLTSSYLGLMPTDSFAISR